MNDWIDFKSMHDIALEQIRSGLRTSLSMCENSKALYPHLPLLDFFSELFVYQQQRIEELAIIPFDDRPVRTLEIEMRTFVHTSTVFNSIVRIYQTDLTNSQLEQLKLLRNPSGPCGDDN